MYKAFQILHKSEGKEDKNIYVHLFYIENSRQVCMKKTKGTIPMARNGELGRWEREEARNEEKTSYCKNLIVFQNKYRYKIDR